MHAVGIEQLEKNRYAVTVDGTAVRGFCSESRARAAGRLEARRLDFVAHETPGSAPLRGARLKRTSSGSKSCRCRSG